MLFWCQYGISISNKKIKNGRNLTSTSCWRRRGIWGFGGEYTPPTTQVLDIVRDLRQELANIRVGNAHFLKVSEEQEKMIKYSTENLSHKPLHTNEDGDKQVPLRRKSVGP